MFTQQVMCGCNVQYYPQRIREFGDNQRPLLLTFYILLPLSLTVFRYIFSGLLLPCFRNHAQIQNINAFILHMKYAYINRHICTDAGTCLQTVSFSHIHTHGYAHNNTYQSIILRENVHELLLFSFTPSFSFLLLDLKYLLIYFLR